MLRKNVKSLLEQLQVCIFAVIVFGVRCTLKWFAFNITERNLSTVASVEDDTEEKASKCELQSIIFLQPANSLLRRLDQIFQ